MKGPYKVEAGFTGYRSAPDLSLYPRPYPAAVGSVFDRIYHDMALRHKKRCPVTCHPGLSRDGVLAVPFLGAHRGSLLCPRASSWYQGSKPVARLHQAFLREAGVPVCLQPCGAPVVIALAQNAARVHGGFGPQ